MSFVMIDPDEHPEQQPADMKQQEVMEEKTQQQEEIQRDEPQQQEPQRDEPRREEPRQVRARRVLTEAVRSWWYDSKRWQLAVAFFLFGALLFSGLLGIGAGKTAQKPAPKVNEEPVVRDKVTIEFYKPSSRQRPLPSMQFYQSPTRLYERRLPMEFYERRHPMEFYERRLPMEFYEPRARVYEPSTRFYEPRHPFDFHQPPRRYHDPAATRFYDHRPRRDAYTNLLQHKMPLSHLFFSTPKVPFFYQEFRQESPNAEKIIPKENTPPPQQEEVTKEQHPPQRGEVTKNEDPPQQQQQQQQQVIIGRHALRTMTVKQLQNYLAQRGVECKACVEKDDLVNQVLLLLSHE